MARTASESEGDRRARYPRGLRRLAHAHGILTRYEDTRGRWQRPPPESVEAVLSAMGVDPAAAEGVGRGNRAGAFGAGAALPPTTPVWLPDEGAGAPPTVSLKQDPPGDGRSKGPAPEDGSVECHLTLEGGEHREWSGVFDADGNLTLPRDLPPGRHDLSLRPSGGTRGSNHPEGSVRTRLLAAPVRCWSPPERGGGGRSRSWGPFLPLHALRSHESWGTGNLSDLRRLGKWTEERGGDFVGVLPLLAGAEASPSDAQVYSPVSRLFWNEIYLDLENAPELEASAEARKILASPGFRREIRRLRESDLVDWAGARESVARILRPLARDVFSRGVPDDLRKYLTERPQVVDYALFRAHWEESEGRPWPEWSEGVGSILERAAEGIRHGHDRAGARLDDIVRDLVASAGRESGYAERVFFHLYAQWLAHRQIAAASRQADLYLDLPLGCHPHGFDAWRHRNLFAAGMSVGAPPDDFFSEGQDWGLPPPLPRTMEETGFAYTAQSLQHSMGPAARLRIDHVMGLHRLFWIPEGASPREGVYVRYPSEALYALHSLESHRSRTVLVGEDLGTVPRSVRRAMARHGMAGMYVWEFELPRDAAADPPSPPRRSLAGLDTHDTPTFAGFWRNREVERRLELGTIDAEEADRQRKEKARIRERWSAFLVNGGYDESGNAEPLDAGAALRGTLRFLAESRAEALVVALEDLWLEEEPQNVPGSGDRHPNFRRKARHDLEEIVSMDAVAEILEEIDDLRSRGGAAAPGGAEEAVSPENSREDGTSPATEPATPAAGTPEVMTPESPLTDHDLHLFNEGRHNRLHRAMGAHPAEEGGASGAHFAVWAPNAETVSVVGDWNGWSPRAHPLRRRGSSGVWEGFVPRAEKGQRYKYHIRSRIGGHEVQKADPFGFRHETPPGTASVLWDLAYEWGDEAWMGERDERNAHDAPISIYEVHMGSWKWTGKSEDGSARPLTYREIADPLVEHVTEMEFTHVEFLPLMEHPFHGSWGYQTTGYFAPTSRYGIPQDLMYLVDRLHRAGVGVILDWVPSHFPADEHGLAFFDGTHLFEHADPREGYHPDWKSMIFNYGRHEVRSFLVSSALFWLELYHADGIRVDAVASMLYRDYGRGPGEWIPNEYGGRENLEAIRFIRDLNEEIYGSFPDVQTMAEESTAWPMVSRPTDLGGLGFGMKWDMGWMNDTLRYMSRDPIHRKFHHHDLTFRRVYAFSENFVLPLSHDEVVHEKGSLLGKMPGDDRQRFANLRLLLAYQTAQPGKKLLFMGAELAQRREWNHDRELDWHLLGAPAHEGVRRLVKELNRLYRDEPALHERDFDEDGFEWIDADDAEHGTLSFLRRGEDRRGEDELDGDMIAVVFNLTPMPRESCRVGVPLEGSWTPILDTDSVRFGGGGRGERDSVDTTPEPWNGYPCSLDLSLPPLAAVFLKPDR